MDGIRTADHTPRSRSFASQQAAPHPTAPAASYPGVKAPIIAGVRQARQHVARQPEQFHESRRRRRLRSTRIRAADFPQREGARDRHMNLHEYKDLQF